MPGWYVDLPTNTVVVKSRPAGLAAARAFVAAGVPAPAVRYATTAEQPRPLVDVIGGNAYTVGSGTRCSVGFSVNGGFITAGHRGATGATTSNPSGAFRGSSFPGNDYARVQVAVGNTPRGLVDDHSGGTVPVAGSQDAPVGSTVCRSGSTTGWHCGTIQARNSSVTCPQGTVSGLIRTAVCAEPGDSGGSPAAGGQAYQPNNSYYRSAVSGARVGCLVGPSDADFDLYPEKWNGSAWAVVAKGDSPTASEALDYSGTAGYYRYRVHACSGSGSYALGVTNP